MWLAAIAPGDAFADEHPTEYAVGAAKVDITPDYPIRLNGFGFRREESEGITQRIWAKALVIGNDQVKPLILITVDSLGIRSSMVDEVARRLKKKAGIERQRLVVTFTHSHTTPKVNGACDTIFSGPIPPEHQAHIDRYTQELTNALEQVALAALADRRPARLEWAVGKVGFAKNRRTEGGPVDHDLPVLVVRSVDDNSIRAIYTTYACHCVTLSHNKISGDWAGYAQEEIERERPGAVALVSIGCGSDSDPDSGVTGDNIAAAAEQGAEIAAEVERLLGGQLRPIHGKLTATLRNIQLPLNTPPIRAELEAAAAHDSPAGYNAKYQLARLDRGEALTTAISYPIQTWSFGDSLAMVFLAGEVCADYSLRLKQELDEKRIWIHGYSNDFCCYIPSERLLREGGYGGGAEIVYFALPATLQPGLEAQIISEVHRQVPRSFRHADGSLKSSRLTPPPASDMLASFQTSGDFVVDLVVAEPLIADPVAIDFGHDGRLWVVEMPDYTRETDELFDQSGRCKALVDRDGDGRFDDASVFHDGLRFPTDVKVWRDGVIVCDAPDVLYLEDTNDDGRADVRKVLLTGFATHNAQARVNSLRWSLDNWLYGACGLFGGHIRSWSGKELELGARDFRFDPDTGEIQPVGGRTQQGRARDDWGNWFGCENGTLVKHYPLLDFYMARNPHVIPPATELFVPEGDDPNRLFPIGDQVLFALSGPPGRPTAVCGLEVYRDELFGPESRGHVFVAEPVNQLVHRLVLTPRGITFRGHRHETEREREFLASTNNWFRPVQVRTGPDGCVWVVDMCRYMIEHPKFIPGETLQRLDPMAGRSAGRIYRVCPKDVSPRPLLRLDLLDTAELVAALDSPNGTQRDLAHQWLVHRDDEAAVPLLEELLANAPRAETRLHALCALDGLGAIREPVLVSALSDPHAGVRRHAVRLSENLVAGSEHVANALLALIADPDIQIQLQLAYSLGEWPDARAAASLAELAWKHHGDEHLMAAILSSIGPANAEAFINAALAHGDELPKATCDAVILASTKFGDANCAETVFVRLSRPSPDGFSIRQIESLADFFDALGERKRELLFHSHASTVEQVTVTAKKLLHDEQASDDAVVAAIRFLTATAQNNQKFIQDLSDFLGPRSSPAVQQAAVTATIELNEPEAAEILLTHWYGFTPALRAIAFDVFLRRNDHRLLLLTEIKSGRIKAGELNLAQRERLLADEDPEIRAAASEAFAGAINADRKKIVESYVDLVQHPGNARHGRELFRKHCASCHRLEDHGHAVGPDLAAVTTRTIPYFLEAIFDPNRTIDERYQTYMAVTDDGHTYTGILSSETASSITLREQEGREQTILRNRLQEFQNSSVSLMPEGMEKDLSASDAADLLAYLQHRETPAPNPPGN